MINEAGISLLRGSEGFSAKKYWDDQDGWTIGYGHLIKPGENIPDEITHEQALELFAKDIAWAEECVKKYVTVPLNENQLAALVSFAFNIGCGAFATSTLVKLLNRGDYQSAADQFLRWVYDDGKKMAGLVTRRGEERKLFLTEV